MTVRQLIDQLKALDTPDAEVFGVRSPYPDEDTWPITGMVYDAKTVGLTGENND